MATKTKTATISSAAGILKYLKKSAKEKNSQKFLLELDDIVNHELELVDNTAKEESVKNTIREINKSAIKAKVAKQHKESFKNLQDYFKGKLFYIAFKESKKYLKFAEIEAIVDKNTLFSFINEIETGQEYAWKLIDNLVDAKLRNFLYGIFTYLYF
ncbi:hypothetical protein RDn1_254 [Candidatus Termititenax dinenymphae]|uniref:Uncharacterized protein n=1 Tax=Candidatus Termititenax dinenymphae TaxID=2218523 RepID=A0A388TMZ7_9BACT|nr:hypothetical protein RDn1_254 [Candidatus Termititenax dinenymphae]